MNSQPASKKTTLIFVRHGETNWNAEERLQGQADVGLSEAGYAQVARIKHVIERLSPTYVVASDLLRTRETASVLGYEHPILDVRLREANLGDWTGQYVSTLLAASAEDYMAWRHGRLTPPNGESWQQLCSRIAEVIGELASRHETILVVTHGGPIRAACFQCLNLSPQHVLPVRSASITTIEFKDCPRLGVYNLRPDDLEFKRAD
jgi:probable phosphoglycerate mutase